VTAIGLGLEEFEGVIRIHISKKNRQHTGQKKKDKQQSTKHTHKDRVTQTRQSRFHIQRLSENKLSRK
jgi:hypothetical protein